MKRLLLAAVLPLVCASMATAEEDPLQAYEPLVYGLSSGPNLPYRLLTPPDYDPEKKYPLVLFLHGAGERGTDNAKQLVHGMKDFLKPEIREKHPCFVVAPQCPDGQRWVEVDWTLESHEMPEKPSQPLGLTFELLESLQAKYSIDSDRVYVTGLSMGGYGSWDALQRKPDDFAAAVVICGGGDERLAGRLKGVPVWAFHGDKDTVVKPQRSTRMVEAINAAGGHARLTMYPGVGHNSWAATYANSEVLDWMFSQRRAKSERK